MNETSSRSHSVFILTLGVKLTNRNAEAAEEGESDWGSTADFPASVSALFPLCSRSLSLCSLLSARFCSLHPRLLFRSQQLDQNTGSKRGAKLTLVDLAGSEKVGKTGAAGQTLEEAKVRAAHAAAARSADEQNQAEEARLNQQSIHRSASLLSSPLHPLCPVLPSPSSASPFFSP